MIDLDDCDNYIVISAFVFCSLCEKLSMETVIVHKLSIDSRKCMMPWHFIHIIYIAVWLSSKVTALHVMCFDQLPHIPHLHTWGFMK